MKRYPAFSNWVTITGYTQDGFIIIKNEMTDKSYLIHPDELSFLQTLDGRTDPYNEPFVVLRGYSRAQIAEMLIEFSKCGLIRNGRLLDKSLLSRNLTVLIPHRKHSDASVWKILNMGLLLSFLPALIFGILALILNNPPYEFDLSAVLGSLAGLAAGSIFHECGHVIAALANGGKVLEIGVSITCLLFPGAYAAISGKESASPLQKAQVSAAGMEVNLLIAGIALTAFSCGSQHSGFFLTAAMMNILLVFDNLLLACGLDGCMVFSSLFGLDIGIDQAARYMVFNRRKRRRLKNGGCIGRASLCSYCFILVFRLAGLMIYPLVIIEVVSCVI